MSELTIDAARVWVTHYKNSASITLPPAKAVEALEFVLNNLDASELHNELLRKALNKWKAYFQSDIPRTRDESEQSGEAFTDAWFEMEQALGTDGGKQRADLRTKLAAAEAELSALREDKERLVSLLVEAIGYFDEQYYRVEKGEVLDATRKGFMYEISQAIDSARSQNK